MNDHDALLAAIAAMPEEDTPRLVFADYLDETGGEVNVAWAEFIRLQVELSRLPANHQSRAALQKRERKLWCTHRHAWRALVPAVPGINWRGFDRGFLTVVDVDQMALFVRHAAAMVAAAPVLSVRILGAAPNVTADLANLPELAQLRELDLTGCRAAQTLDNQFEAPIAGYWWARDGVLTDGDAAALARSPRVANLRVLRLNGNRIGDAGVWALAASPFLRNLRRLEVARPAPDVEITPAALAALQRAHPDAEIL